MTRDHLLVIDQGTTSTRAVVYDARLQVGRPGPGARSCRLTPTRAGSSTTRMPCSRSVGPQVTRRARRVGREGRPDRGHRPDQPARDDDRLGARDRQGDRAGPGLARPPHGRGLRAAQGPPGMGLRADRPGHRPVLLRHQDRLDPRPCPRGPPPRRGRRAGRGDGRQLPDLAPDRRPAVRHRRDQRLPDAAHGPARPSAGPTISAIYSEFRPEYCPRSARARAISA